MRSDIVSEALGKYGKCIEQNSFNSFAQALRAAPDSCAEEFMQKRPKSKFLTFVLSLFCGVAALDRFYLGETRSAVSKLVLNLVSLVLCGIPFIVHAVTGSMGFWGFLLYAGAIAAAVALTFYFGDVFSLRKKAKDINYRILVGFLHDKTNEAKETAEETV